MQLGAAIVGVGPLYGLSIYAGYVTFVTGEFQVPTSEQMLGNITVMLFFVALILALLMVCGERPRDLQLRAGTLADDLGQGLLLFAMLIGLIIVLNITLGLLGLDTVPEANLRIGEALAADPMLLAIFLGPVVWLQAGITEELTRAFVLTRLWHVWPRAKLISLVLWSAVFGLAHIYQGVAGVVGTALIGLLLGAHYLQRGRVLPLILAHALYDTLVILLLVFIARNPELLDQARQSAALLPWAALL